MSSIDQQFIEYIVKSIVGNPDAVEIERRIDEKGVLLELTVDPEDLGRVIGKRGATAQSLRTLLRALGTKNDARYNLKIVDTGSPAPRDSDTSSNDSTSSDDTTSVADSSDPAISDEATSSSSSDGLDDLRDEDDTTNNARTGDRHSDVVSQTRKELAELDDLDV